MKTEAESSASHHSAERAVRNNGLLPDVEHREQPRAWLINRIMVGNGNLDPGLTRAYFIGLMQAQNPDVPVALLVEPYEDYVSALPKESVEQLQADYVVRDRDQALELVTNLEQIFLSNNNKEE
jgi:hypothetical protein